ncbi:MAG: class II fructose-bisphosphate aldolase [Candidatus Zixiibacteriota bacterium]|nr:MAG: class II fructose-bisphosphate aldolase [candidate division Zixibacteria bacterium]
MLTTLEEVLADARKNGYAVPAFDCVEDVMVRAILETCEEMLSPVVLMCLVGADLDGNGWAYVPGLVRAVADSHAIPIVLHLDHATELESIKKAVDGGFTSVMIDGSMHPFDKNVEITKATAQIAHPKGISVEGELGWVGGFDLQARSTGQPVLTEPKEVEKFVSMTGVDALAVSIGTSHGVYESLPNLDIEKLKELNEASSVPLVLHGGSGTPDSQIQEAVRNGICKMNIYADNRIAMAKGLTISAESQTRPDPPAQELFGPIKEEMAKVVKEKIALLLSADRA